MKKEKKDGFVKGFIEFIKKGNIISLAIAFILGTAFNAIVTSFVNDITMPIIAAIVGKPDFSNLTAKLGSATIYYGKFITAVVNFLLIALFIYIVLVVVVNKIKKGIEKMKKEEEEKPAEPVVVEDPEDIKLLKQISESLKNLESQNKNGSKKS